MTNHEAFKLGMEHAAQRCDEEALSAARLVKENPHLVTASRNRVEGVMDGAEGLARTIRHFAKDEDYIKAALTEAPAEDNSEVKR